ncbi:MAG TPA: hypothetical protein VL096_21910 [Pirellulaceae bacterium]|nr:hypothetical protein [Pirellulaceae bacterium]
MLSPRYAVTLGLSLATACMIFVTTSWARAACPHCQSKAGCCEQDVIEHVCKMVVEKKPIKKVVYECKKVPYCVHKVPRLGACGGCAECEACPRYKTVLIKREIVVGEKCETKCVVEAVSRKAAHCQHCQAPLTTTHVAAQDERLEPPQVDVAPITR